MTPALHFTQFGKYEIIRKLGRSMTDVYLALDPETNRRVVLKIVEQCRDPYTQLVVEAERRGALIQRELHAMDPRILEVYEHGDRNGCFFVVMQYAEGESLAQSIERETRIAPERAARIAAEVCSQLTTLHSFQADLDGHRRAVVHGDIKPSNIQVGPNGEVWLLDFGIAKVITATRNLTQHNLGSPAYCSPERIKRGQVDPHSDLWALGVCLYEMLAGMPPYQAQTTRKLENLIQSRRPPRALPGSCPSALQAILWKALAADMNRRYQSASEFESDLRAFLNRKPTLAERERQPAWDANATLEKAKPSSAPARIQFSKFIAQFNVLMWSLIAGLIVGLVCFVPATYLYSFWTHSAPLRATRDYVRASVPDIEADWQLYRSLEQQYSPLGRLSPMHSLRKNLRGRLFAAANSAIDGYRNSSDATLDHFDWERARFCLSHALELNPQDEEAKSKLALAEGYLRFMHDRDGLDQFKEAVTYQPNSPDPHVALARYQIYSARNVGQAMAEFHAAERLGFKLGPREFEQQADGYRYRAEDSLREWRVTKQRKQLLTAERDMERARSLYEPIAGFSNVNVSLERLEDERASVEKVQADSVRARLEAIRRPRSYRRWR